MIATLAEAALRSLVLGGVVWFGLNLFRVRNPHAHMTAWVVVAATLQGFAASAILILVLALPALLSKSDDVHRVTAAMFTISYSCAVIVPVISGLAWDLTGIAKMAFLPIALCGILLVMLAPAINHVPRTAS